MYRVHIAPMHLAQYMAELKLDDDAMADRVRTPDVPCDRSEINKYRRRKLRPSWAKIARIKKVTGGLVGADDWLVEEAAE